jgi:hypothetical protein
MTLRKTTLVTANAVNMLVMINESIVENFKKGAPAQIVLPTIVARAILVHDESGMMPVTETLDVNA